MATEREVENVAVWMEAELAKDRRFFIPIKARMVLARALLDSGALTMGACAYYDNESVRMMTVDYDRQAAAIEKIKGGGDDR